MTERTPELFIFDLDGTAVNSQHYALPSDLLVAAVDELKVNNFVSCATGRPLTYGQDILDRLRPNAPVVIAAGTEIYDWSKGETIWSQTIDEQALNRMGKVFKSMGELCFHGNTNFVNGALEAREVDFAESSSVYYFINLGFDRAKQIVYDLREIDGIAATYMSTMLEDLPKEDGWRFDVHIMSSKTSKYQATRRLQGLLGVGVEHTTAFGNGYNDLPLFKAAKNKIAVWNADSALLNVATGIMGTPEEDGLAIYLEQVLKNQRMQ